MKLRSTKLYQSPIAPKVLELDITFLIETAEGSYRHKLSRTDRNGKVEKETEQLTEELSDTESQNPDMMLLKFLRNALQLNLYECNAQAGAH